MVKDLEKSLGSEGSVVQPVLGSGEGRPDTRRRGYSDGRKDSSFKPGYKAVEDYLNSAKCRCSCNCGHCKC